MSQRQRVAHHRIVLRSIAKRRAELEEHPLLADGQVGEFVSNNRVAFVVVGDADILALQRHDLRHAGFGYLDDRRLRGQGIAPRRHRARRCYETRASDNTLMLS